MRLQQETPPRLPIALRRRQEVIPHVRGERWLPFSLAFVAREWLLEPVDEGTRLSMRWQVRSHGLLPTLPGLALRARSTLQMMQTAFRRLDSLLAAAWATPVAEPTTSVPA